MPDLQAHKLAFERVLRLLRRGRGPILHLTLKPGDLALGVAAGVHARTLGRLLERACLALSPTIVTVAKIVARRYEAGAAAPIGHVPNAGVKGHGCSSMLEIGLRWGRY